MLLKNVKSIKKRKEDTIKFSMYMRAGNVESGPPLSTILGNYGVITANFCKDVNDITQDLPNYFFIEVGIIINEDKSYIINIKEPTVALLLKLCSIKLNKMIFSKGRYKNKSYKCVKIKDIYYISSFKFGYININTLKNICSILYSLDYYIID